MSDGSTEIVRVGKLEVPQDITVERLRELPNFLNTFYKNVMQEGTDYGTLPGTKKPSLWKPGAELLSRILHMHESTMIVHEVEIFDKTNGGPYFQYKAHCKLYAEDGGYLGDGVGSANTKEPSEAFKWVFERDVPAELDKNTLPKNEKGMIRIPLSDNEVYGKQNAIRKKAKKRAFVDAVLTVTGASRIFTQDIEDESSHEPEEKHETKKSETPKKAATLEQIEYELREFDGLELTQKEGVIAIDIVQPQDKVKFETIKAVLAPYGARLTYEAGHTYFKISP